ncbi:hypothetical protein IE53DRAFT_176286 [Violaceomyces palustris]|uniref:Uncharacterized protein n=1 Tax=Violaceomyces palustris TaxID=1673888 RepID=A0ACD0NSQ0_9BASI|nr:hypothetical protein IE53DRAFT_176286 [Violaceomyces palustris]
MRLGERIKSEPCQLRGSPKAVSVSAAAVVGLGPPPSHPSFPPSPTSLGSEPHSSPSPFRTSKEARSHGAVCTALYCTCACSPKSFRIESNQKRKKRLYGRRGSQTERNEMVGTRATRSHRPLSPLFPIEDDSGG